PAARARAAGLIGREAHMVGSALHFSVQPRAEAAIVLAISELSASLKGIANAPQAVVDSLLRFLQIGDGIFARSARIRFPNPEQLNSRLFWSQASVFWLLYPHFGHVIGNDFVLRSRGITPAPYQAEPHTGLNVVAKEGR